MGKRKQEEAKEPAHLFCPECGSEEVTLASVQKFMANTREYFCENVKIDDSNSPATCLNCQWEGRHDQLTGYEMQEDETTSG